MKMSEMRSADIFIIGLGTVVGWQLTREAEHALRKSEKVFYLEFGPHITLAIQMGGGKRGFTDRTKAPRFARTAGLKGKYAISCRVSCLADALIYLRLRKLHVSRSIVNRRLAEGERLLPRRRMMPIVRKISGSVNRIARTMGWPGAGVARRGRTAIPSPASTRPSDPDRCATS